MPSLTIYSLYNPTPAVEDELNFDEFCLELQHRCEEEQGPGLTKQDLLCFGLHKLNPGTTRAALNVADMSAIIGLDVDNATNADVDSLIARVHSLGINCVMHGSPSDDPASERRKLHVFVEGDRSWLPEESYSMHNHVADLLGVARDSSCDDPARVLFTGRLHGTPPRFFWQNRGSKIELPADLPKSHFGWTETKSSSPTTEPSEVIRHGDAAAEILALLGSAADYEGRKHSVVVALSGVLRKTGIWSRGDCAALVDAWVKDYAENREAAWRTAQAAWDKPASEVSGYAKLASLVGDTTARSIEKAAMSPLGRKPDAEGPQPFSGSPITATDWRQPPELTFFVEDLSLASGKVSAIQAYPGVSKTPFALLLSLCLASGAEFLGCRVRQCKVAYIDHEGGALTLERAARLCDGLGLRRDDVPLHTFSASPIDDRYVAEIERMIVEDGFKAFIVDTYSSAVDDTTFNESGIRRWAVALGTVATKHNALVVILLHENKGAQGTAGIKGISGHSTLGGALQASIALSASSDSGDDCTIGVHCARGAYHKFKDFNIRWTDVTSPASPTGRALVCSRVEPPQRPATANSKEAYNRDVDAAIAIAKVVRGMSLQMKKSEILDAAGLSLDKPARRAWKLLIDEGMIVYAHGRLFTRGEDIQDSDLARLLLEET